jgi:hypothetical protein
MRISSPSVLKRNRSVPLHFLCHEALTDAMNESLANSRIGEQAPITAESSEFDQGQTIFFVSIGQSSAKKIKHAASCIAS